MNTNFLAKFKNVLRRAVAGEVDLQMLSGFLVIAQERMTPPTRGTGYTPDDFAAMVQHITDSPCCPDTDFGVIFHNVTTRFFYKGQIASLARTLLQKYHKASRRGGAVSAAKAVEDPPICSATVLSSRVIDMSKGVDFQAIIEDDIRNRSQLQAQPQPQSQPPSQAQPQAQPQPPPKAPAPPTTRLTAAIDELARSSSDLYNALKRREVDSETLKRSDKDFRISQRLLTETSAYRVAAQTAYEVSGEIAKAAMARHRAALDALDALDRVEEEEACRAGGAGAAPPPWPK